MDDLISRQAAIDALGEEPEVWTEKDEYAQGLNNQWHYDVNALKAVSPAQPDVPDINDGDMISRRAVQEMIDRIGGMYPYRQIGNRDSYSQYNEAWTDAINRVDAELNSLPSVQPEPERTMEEFMYGQDMGNPEDGSL